MSRTPSSWSVAFGRVLENGLLGFLDAETVDAELVVSDGTMGALIDRFGADVETAVQEDGTARAKVQVVAGPLFYGWLANLGGAVKVADPASLEAGYKAHLQKTLAAC